MFRWNLTLFNNVIYLVYITNIFVICSLSRFRGQHHSRPDPAAQDIFPDNDCPDPNDLQDFELPDHSCGSSDSTGPFHESQHARKRPGWRPRPYFLASLAEERRRLLHKDRTPRDRCKTEVCYIIYRYIPCFKMVYDIIMNVI